MARAFWKGAISFGMVVIPVRMYIATGSRTLPLHLLHKKCLTRPKQVPFCEPDNEYFSIKDTVRGYEYTKGQYVVLDETDFQKVPIRTARAIEIKGFVQSKEIDPVYFYDCHCLEPEELGVKPFSLLRQILLKTGRVGVAKVSFQKREHLMLPAAAGAHPGAAHAALSGRSSVSQRAGVSGGAGHSGRT